MTADQNDPRIKQAEDIRARIRIAGWTCLKIDRHFELKRGSATSAIQKAHELGEQAIAKTLGVHPSQLWPERYGEDGERLSPQPKRNYRSPPTHAQRRNSMEARP